MKTEQHYTAPQLTVVCFTLERGFAASTLRSLAFWELEATNHVESYTDHTEWNGGDGFWH